MFGDQAADKLIADYSFNNVLDIGSGFKSSVWSLFDKNDKQVVRQDINPEYNPDILGDFNLIEIDGQFDCVWCSHVLEHQLNVNHFLKKIFNCLKDDGVLAITVPPLKKEIVGGHVSLWNAGLLLYNLILAGFNCKEASVKTYGYNVSVIVKKKKAELPNLKYDSGDIKELAEFFPFNATEGFNGEIDQWNW